MHLMYRFVEHSQFRFLTDTSPRVGRVILSVLFATLFTDQQEALTDVTVTCLHNDSASGAEDCHCHVLAVNWLNGALTI